MSQTFRPPPAPPRRRTRYLLLAALLVLGLLAAGGYAIYRRYTRPNTIKFHVPGPTVGVTPNVGTGDVTIDPRLVLPYRVLRNERATRDGRRYLRRFILVPHDARREQVRHTLYQAFADLPRWFESTEVTVIWAIPDERLLAGSLLFRDCNLLAGELVFATDLKGFRGQPVQGPLMTINLVAADSQAPSRQDLGRFIEACGALDEAAQRGALGPNRIEAILERVGRRHGLGFHELRLLLHRLRQHYGVLQPYETPLTAGGSPSPSPSR